MDEYPVHDANAKKSGPVLNPRVEEVQGVFPTDVALQEAVSLLTLAGFDHAALSLPHSRPSAGSATPEQGAQSVVTDTDMRQARTMGTSMAGTIGAMAAAGAVVATGGAALLAVAAAAAVGAGSALAANAVGTAVEHAQTDGRDAAAEFGELVLSVQASGADRQAVARRIMEAAGAVKVAVVAREDGAISAV